MSILRRIIPLAALLTFMSCQAVSNLIHDDEVVARVGKSKLFKSELEAFIPVGTTPEDSTRIAGQYINSWATERLFLDMASLQLSKSEKDVSSELEDYRNSLLRYRYEQKYINERLDTVITASEIETYYEAHSDIFELDVPIVRARFLDIMQDSPDLELIRRKMSSDKYDDLVLADSLAYSSALRYFDSSDRWITAVELAREFGTDYATMLSSLHNSYIEIPQDRGDVKIAYICDIRRGGTLAPLEYCEERIRDIIISGRKHTLLNNLEQDLLEDALERDNFEIY